MTTEIKTPLRIVADYHVPFCYSSIPDLCPEDISPAMRPLAGRTIGLLRIYAEGEVAGSTYRWDVDVSGIDSEQAFFNAIECHCEWLTPNSLLHAAGDLIRLHDAGHIVLADREVPAVETLLAENVKVAA